MGAVVGITAKLQAKNGMTPELEDVVKATRHAVKEMLGLDDATQDMIKEMRKMKQAAEQSAHGFNREIDKMQREIQDLRRQLGGLDATRATPKITVDDQVRREIAAIRQEVKALDGEKARVQIEASQAGGSVDFAAGGVAGGMATYLGAGYLDQLTLETQANARRALLGDKPEELLQFQKQSQDLSMINPNVDRTYIKDLMTQATRFDSQNGAEFTKQALQLNAIRPDLGGVEEYQKTMFAMQQAWKDITDVGRFGDTLAEIANTTTDIRGEALDSIVEYSTQVTKFLDTPEKLAALTKEMNSLWSIDKGFDSIKEATIKLDNQGDLTNVLSTAYQAQGLDSDAAMKKATTEAQIISKAIHSNNQADNQFAVAALLQNFGSIKNESVRQQLLNELGGGPGEDVAKAYAPLLQAAGRIGTTDASQFNYSGKLDESFKAFQANDPLRGFLEAKTMFSNELIGLGVVLAQDLGPAIKWTAEQIKEAKELIDKAPIWATLTGLGVVVGGLTYAFWKMKIAVEAATEAAVRERLKKKLGGEMPDVDIPGGPDKKKRGGGGGSKKRKWYNPLSWAGGKQDPPPKKNWLTSQEAADMAFGKNAPREVPTKTNWLTSTLKSVGGVLPSGDTTMKGIKSAWEGVKSVGGGLTKRLPIIGLAVGAGEILQSDNKLETAARLGTETLGGWGGAAAGAAIGSVVPGIGTAIGGIVGAIAGSFGGSALFEGIKKDLEKQVLVQDPRRLPSQEAMAEIRKTMPKPPVYGPPVPTVSPVAKTNEKPKVVSLSVQSVPITLKADGVLQDVNGMLQLLRQSTVSNEVVKIVEKALLDALETRGGVAT